MSDENQPPNQSPTPPNRERKTLDDRARMTELDRIRHSCAHVMTTAILRLWPAAQFAYWPPIENGFYYHLECSHRISPESLEKVATEPKEARTSNNLFKMPAGCFTAFAAGSNAGRLESGWRATRCPR